MVRPYVLAWLGLCGIAFLNGTLREFAFARWMSSKAAHGLSTITLLIAIAIFIFWVIRRWPPQDAAHAVAVGIAWLIATLAFEFLFGHYASGRPWAELFADYNVLEGRLWVLVPLEVAIAPYFVYRTL